MRNRRQFLKDAAGASAGMFFLGSSARSSQAEAPTRQAGAATKRREIRVGQRRVKTVDVHSHIALPEAAEVLKAPLWRSSRLEALRVPGQIHIHLAPSVCKQWTKWELTFR
jgi:hypothetical protein